MLNCWWRITFIANNLFTLGTWIVSDPLNLLSSQSQQPATHLHHYLQQQYLPSLVHFLMPTNFHRSASLAVYVIFGTSLCVVSTWKMKVVSLSPKYQSCRRRLLRTRLNPVFFLVIIQMRRAIKSDGCKHRPFIHKVNSKQQLWWSYLWYATKSWLNSKWFHGVFYMVLFN